MQALKKHGVNIPEVIALVAFNNDAIGKMVEPKLTIVNYPGLNMDENAARNLINSLRRVSSVRYKNTIIVRSERIIRKSSLRKTKP